VWWQRRLLPLLLLLSLLLLLQREVFDSMGQASNARIATATAAAVGRAAAMVTPARAAACNSHGALACTAAATARHHRCLILVQAQAHTCQRV
jgi:hypothetical protein